MPFSGCFNPSCCNDSSSWPLHAHGTSRTVECYNYSDPSYCLWCFWCSGKNSRQLFTVLTLTTLQGAYAIKLAKLSNIHPIIAVAGRGAAFVESLIDRKKGDTIVDYRNGDSAVVTGIQEALKKAGTKEVKYAFDAVSEHNSFQNISQVLSKHGSKITLVLPGKDFSAIPNHIEKSTTMVGSVHMDPSEGKAKAGIITGGKESGYVFFRLFSRGLQQGWFSGHPHEVVPGGLNGVEKGLSNLKEGVNSATKYVFKIEDTK
jgi:NADPH:quinone reductase